MSSIRKRSVEDFAIGDCIGEGSYSRVYRAISKSNKKTYAIKILDKQHIHREQKRKYVTIEKDTLNLLGQHDGIVTLYYTFQDAKKLYFVIDYASNGELLNLIHKYGSLNEKVVKYYSVQLIDSLSFIHSKNVIHRDLKPENILLNADWKIMITDFGAAKVISKEDDEQQEEKETKKGSFVGTAEYVTPELLEKNECGFESDYWALGCIIFQMIIGRPPFKEATEYDTFLKIINLDYKFPIDCAIPKLLENLIVNLLKLDPKERLNFDQMKSHKWFKGVNWGDWRAIWGHRVPKFSKYDSSPLLVLNEVKQNNERLNLKKQIYNNQNNNKQLMDKVITRSNTANSFLTDNKRRSPVIPQPENMPFFPPQRKVSSDAVLAAGAVGGLMNRNSIPRQSSAKVSMVNPILLDKNVPKIILDKLQMNEKILKLDNIMKSELVVKPNQYIKRGDQLTDVLLQNIIKRNEYQLQRDLKVCILVITSSARLLIYELESDMALRSPYSSTLMQAKNFYSKVIEIKLTNNTVSLYDYEFDEETKDGYLILELTNVNKLIFLSNWDKNKINKGGLNLNVRVGFNIGENDSFVNSLLRAKDMIKARQKQKRQIQRQRDSLADRVNGIVLK